MSESELTKKIINEYKDKTITVKLLCEQFKELTHYLKNSTFILNQDIAIETLQEVYFWQGITIFDLINNLIEAERVIIL